MERSFRDTQMLGTECELFRGFVTALSIFSYKDGVFGGRGTNLTVCCGFSDGVFVGWGFLRFFWVWEFVLVGLICFLFCFVFILGLLLLFLHLSKDIRNTTLMKHSETYSQWHHLREIWWYCATKIWVLPSKHTVSVSFVPFYIFPCNQTKQIHVPSNLFPPSLLLAGKGWQKEIPGGIKQNSLSSWTSGSPQAGAQFEGAGSWLWGWMGSKALTQQPRWWIPAGRFDPCFLKAVGKHFPGQASPWPISGNVHGGLDEIWSSLG